MCGIMGYVGHQAAVPLLLQGLRRLEYRGYDSSGVAIGNGQGLTVARAKGKLEVLENRLASENLTGTIGIGHTRWATHGRPSDNNAHPHRSERVAVIHNGIIENHLALREKLLEAGFVFQSETDTEIVPLLIEFHLRQSQDLLTAVRKAISEMKGAFALGILSSVEPEKLIVAKSASPLVLGLGEGENFLASDVPALLDHTRKVVVLEDGEMAILTKSDYQLMDFEGRAIRRAPKVVTWSRLMAEKEGFKHFMLKEIHEQPRAVADTLRSRILEAQDRIVLDEVALHSPETIKRVVLVACGTSWHAALVAKFWIEAFARLPVEVDLASEFRYRQGVLGKDVLFVPISQSGETADTLAALELARDAGAFILSICNCMDSSIARKSSGVLYTHAGPEIGVASTKAFTTQLSVLAILALYLGKARGTLERETYHANLGHLLAVPGHLETCLKEHEKISEFVQTFLHTRDFLFLGRGTSFPIALEGALKLKEISYIHAEGYAGGEMKHGPIALIDEDMPVVALASGGHVLPKMLGNMEEAKARGGQIIAVTTEGNNEVSRLADHVICVPQVDDFIRPIVEVVPLQLLAYDFADKLGTDVDQPRNLAKSVTVE